MTSLPRSPRRPWLRAASLALAAAAIGWWAVGVWSHGTALARVHKTPGPSIVAGAVTQKIEPVLSQVAQEKSSSRQFAMIAAAPLPTSAGALRAWLDRLESLPNGEARELAQRLLVRDGSGIPFEEMAAVLSASDYRATSALARSWAEREGLSGLTKALSLTEVPIASSLIDQMAGACARIDPQGTVDLLLKQNAPVRTQSALSSVFSEWVKHDPAAATARLESLTVPQRSRPARDMVTSWARTNPEQALAWANNAPPLQEDVISELFSTWFETDPQRAAEAVIKQPSGMNGQRGLVWDNWSQRDPQGMLEWINAQTDLPGRAKEGLLSKVAQSLVRSNPERAWSIVKELPGSNEGGIVNGTSRGVLTSDPSAAKDWSSSVIDRSPLEDFYRAMAHPDMAPEARDRIVELLPDNEPAAVSGQLTLLARTDPAAAKEYWETLPPDMKLPTSRQMISDLIERSPEVAAVMLREKMENRNFGAASDTSPDALGRTEAMEASRVAVALAAGDPSAAKEWMTSLPPGPAAAEAAANFAANYGRFDHAGVEEWINTQPGDSPLRSGLLRGLAWLDASLGDPDAALAYARQLPPEGSARLDTFRDVFNAWNRIDPDAAESAFDAYPFTEAERARLGAASGK